MSIRMKMAKKGFRIVIEMLGGIFILIPIYIDLNSTNTFKV